MQASRSGVEGIYTGIQHLELGLSGGGSFPVNSNRNNARKGMPNLDAIGQFGPSLDYKFYTSAYQEWQLRLPLRAAISLNLQRLAYQGLAFEPHIRYTLKQVWDRRSRISISAGPLFFYDGLHDYYYTVEQQYATESRFPFRARSGYVNSEISIFLSYQLHKQFTLFSGINLFFNYGAANQSSPLYREDTNFSFSFGCIYSFWQSQLKKKQSRER